MVTLFLMSSVQTQQPTIPGPSFEDMLNLRDIGNAVIAPDGGAVAYTVRSADWDQNSFDTEIWLVRDGGEPLQLTRTDKGKSTNRGCKRTSHSSM